MHRPPDPQAFLRFAPISGENIRGRPALQRTQYADIDLRGIKVLVVDDEPSARALIKRVPPECHADVRAGSGVVARRLAR